MNETPRTDYGSDRDFISIPRREFHTIQRRLSEKKRELALVDARIAELERQIDERDAVRMAQLLFEGEDYKEIVEEIRTARITELERDRARLDWLLDCIQWPEGDETVWYVECRLKGKDGRTAIDNAMKEET